MDRNYDFENVTFPASQKEVTKGESSSQTIESNLQIVAVSNVIPTIGNN